MSIDDIYDAINKESGRMNKAPLPVVPLKRPVFRGSYSFAYALRIIDYSDMEGYEGDEFIMNAYRLLLHRDADPAGLSYYHEKLTSGTGTKQDIVAEINLSEEGAGSGVFVKGCKVDRLDAGKLLRLEGEIFINMCFFWILGHEPDASSKENYIQEMRVGRFKALILHEIEKSEEGTAWGVTVYGYRKAYYISVIKDLLLRAPITGRLIRYIYSFR